MVRADFLFSIAFLREIPHSVTESLFQCGLQIKVVSRRHFDSYHFGTAGALSVTLNLLLINLTNLGIMAIVVSIIRTRYLPTLHILLGEAVVKLSRSHAELPPNLKTVECTPVSLPAGTSAEVGVVPARCSLAPHR